jgi:hypothetical protein
MFLPIPRRYVNLGSNHKNLTLNPWFLPLKPYILTIIVFFFWEWTFQLLKYSPFLSFFSETQQMPQETNMTFNLMYHKTHGLWLYLSPQIILQPILGATLNKVPRSKAQ